MVCCMLAIKELCCSQTFFLHVLLDILFSPSLLTFSPSYPSPSPFLPHLLPYHPSPSPHPSFCLTCKAHYLAARDTIMSQINMLLTNLFQYQRELEGCSEDSEEAVRLRNIRYAYGTLISCIPKTTKDDMLEEIKKRAKEMV